MLFKNWSSAYSSAKMHPQETRPQNGFESYTGRSLSSQHQCEVDRSRLLTNFNLHSICLFFCVEETFFLTNATCTY